VTGFEKDEIAVTVESNVLTVKGEGAESVRHEQPEIVYLHRGLATRDFVREFPLAEHIEVAGAEIRNGMLIVKLIRNIPESAKPKIIDIVEVK
jgi:molecular chaperone IbpA